MYQSVDDVLDEQSQKPHFGANRLKIIASIVGGFILLSAVAFFSSQTQIEDNTSEQEFLEQRAVYLTALQERSPPLRRARLIDFVETYPENERVAAAKAQLAVLQSEDDKDWLALQNVIYDTRQSRPIKLAAIELYESLWGSNLLGSRDTEIQSFRTRLMEDPVEIDPDSESAMPDFTPEPDEFDASINDNVLAGDIENSKNRYIPPSSLLGSTYTPPGAIVVEPSVRKNVNPRYPSRAQKRGVEALVTLALTIDSEGEVVQTELVSIEARRYRRDFIRAAEGAALRTKFNPRTVNDRPVATTGFVRTYSFSMEN